MWSEVEVFGQKKQQRGTGERWEAAVWRLSSEAALEKEQWKEREGENI